MKKQTRKYDSHSRKVKQAIGKPIVIGRKGEWTLGPVEDKRGQDKEMRGLTKLSEEASLEMARDKAAGSTDKELSEKYGMHTNHIREALKRVYISSAAGRRILKGILLENAVAFGIDAGNKMDELTGLQAAMATKIMTSSYIDLDKHDRDAPKTIDIDALEQMSKDIKQIRDGLDS